MKHTVGRNSYGHSDHLTAKTCDKETDIVSSIECIFHLLPATSSTCNSVALASSAGSFPKRLSLRESTFKLTHPPSSAGTLLKRFRSTFKLVNFFSFPSERGRDWKWKQHNEVFIMGSALTSQLSSWNLVLLILLTPLGSIVITHL